MIEVAGIAVTAGIALFAVVYAATRDTVVKLTGENLKRVLAESKEAIAIAIAERNEWMAQHKADRAEIHALRNEFNGELNTLRDQWENDKIELAKLRERTDFGPVETKLNNFIESQTRVNEALLMNLQVFAEVQKQQTVGLEILMRQLVPALTKEQIAEQEKPI